MTSATFDVLGIGNAIVDVISRSDEAFLGKHGLVKGSMMLIDEARAEQLYAGMGPGVEVSGGSCGNTMAGIASFGGKGAYIGKVRDDQLGGVFGHDLKATGVSFETPAATDGPATARCLILVTPDAQRTMNTYLGACTGLGPADIDTRLVASAQVTYVEGYLWDAPAAKQAVLKAFDAARAAGRKVSITLSDSFCVHRYRDEFRDLIRNKVDILFGNEAEIRRSRKCARRPRSPPSRAARRARSWSRAMKPTRSPQPPSPRSSTRPAPAISTPRASCSASPTASRWPNALAWAESPPPR